MAVAAVVGGTVGTEALGTEVVGTEAVVSVPAEQLRTEARSVEQPYTAATELLALATRGLAAAAATPHPYDRYAAAQLAALRAAAGLVAQRAPATGRSRVTSVWKLLARKVPELGEWAAFFQSMSHNRVVTPGTTGWVTSRDADDMLREAATFVDLVAKCLGRHDDGIRALGDRLVCT
ncbi:MAG: SAV_6107 family HEPN domain-containing protein [Candidatus Nanopelagicales bacterium]